MLPNPCSHRILLSKYREKHLKGEGEICIGYPNWSLRCIRPLIYNHSWLTQQNVETKTLRLINTSRVTGSYQNTTKPLHQYLRRAGHLVDAWDNYITRMLVTQNHLPQPTSQNNQHNTTNASNQQKQVPNGQPNHLNNQTQGKPTRSPPEFLSFQIQSAVQGLGWVGFFSCGEGNSQFLVEKNVSVFNNARA